MLQLLKSARLELLLLPSGFVVLLTSDMKWHTFAVRMTAHKGYTEPENGQQQLLLKTDQKTTPLTV